MWREKLANNQAILYGITIFYVYFSEILTIAHSLLKALKVSMIFLVFRFLFWLMKSVQVIKVSNKL